MFPAISVTAVAALTHNLGYPIYALFNETLVRFFNSGIRVSVRSGGGAIIRFNNVVIVIIVIVRAIHRYYFSFLLQYGNRFKDIIVVVKVNREIIFFQV